MRKAVRIHQLGPESVLRHKEGERPVPEKGKILVRVAATSVNAVDLKLREGVLHGLVNFPLPLILDCDLAGTVEWTDHSHFKLGDRVFGMPANEVGMYAEYVNMLESELASIPTHVSFERAASLPKTASRRPR